MAEEVTIFARGDVDETSSGFLEEDKKRVLSFRLPTETVRKNLQEFLSSLAEILPSATASNPGFGVDSFEVAVSINGKGQVGFLGTGGELGGSATLTLTFKRN